MAIDEAAWVLERAPTPHTESKPKLEPLDWQARTANPLRPQTFGEMIGQERLKALLRRIVAEAKSSGRPLDHMLLVGSAGTGKTTLAQVMAHELERPVFMLKAPVAFDIFEELTQVASDGDVVVVDEIHLQVSGDRRGITQAADPETFYSVMEDHRLVTTTGARPFPNVSFIGATTDAGLLPEPFLARFPLQPRLDPYTWPQMGVLATWNAEALGMGMEAGAAIIFARASRKIPRVVNRYVRNAQALGAKEVSHTLAVEIVTELWSTTLDGLDRDMANMLRYLFTQKRVNKAGEVRYLAGMNSIATALGKSRDSKSIALYVEPYLVEQGYVAITHSGRELTPQGLERVRGL